MAKAWTCIYRGSPAVRWTTREGKVRTKRCPSARIARDLAEQVNRALLLTGEWSPPDERPALPRPAEGREPDLDLDLVAVAGAWLEDQRRTLARRTLENYALYMDLLEGWAQASAPGRAVQLGELSRAWLTQGWAWLLEPAQGRHGRARSPATAAKIVEVWVLLWRWAADSDDYAAHCPPPRSIALPRRPAPSPLAWTWGQAAACLAELRATAPAWTVRVFELAWYLGERRDALCRLEWSAVEWSRRRLVVPAEITKGGAGGRVVPLHPELLERLRSWGPSTGPIVGAPPLELTGRGHVDRTIRRAWRRSGVPAEVWSGQPIHGARACLRTHLAARNVSGQLIDAYLGHKTPGTGGRHYTDRAALVGPLRAVVELIPSIDSVQPDPTGAVDEEPS